MNLATDGVASASTAHLRILGSHFVDPQGRHVLLHGINVVNKSRHEGYIVDEGPGLYARLRDWGFNVIRLGVIWDGLEPEPGTYDEAYLKRLDEQIDWARAYGLLVFLDMHQDLYSVLYSDGAPAWATLTGGAPHVDLGGVWSDAYFTSPAVQAALDNFWADAPAPDGIGIQEHYVRAWAHLARRYAQESAIIGFDIMNEPFPGSAAARIQEQMFAKGAELIAAMGLPFEGTPFPTTADASPVESLAEQWLTPSGRSAILGLLRDADLYAQVVDATEPLYAEFEATSLMPMVHRVAEAIRATGSKQALFLETTMGSNMGVRSAIVPVELAGRRDPAQVYAPHGYDLVVDTPDIAQASPERVAFIFRRHGETADRLDMPMLVGEWGAYGDQPGTLPAAWHVVQQFEALLCSETYWTYQSSIQRFPCFQAIQRPYPERVAGTLQHYAYNPASGIFQANWREDGQIATPTRVYLPDWYALDDSGITVSPAGSGITFVETLPGSGNRYLEISPTGGSCNRTLIIRRSEL